MSKIKNEARDVFFIQVTAGARKNKKRGDFFFFFCVMRFIAIQTASAAALFSPFLIRLCRNVVVISTRRLVLVVVPSWKSEKSEGDSQGTLRG